MTHQAPFGSSRLWTALALTCLFLPVTRAEAQTRDLTWWSSRTSDTNVVETSGRPESARLGNFTTGSIEGTITLPCPSNWMLSFTVNSDENALRDQSDYVDITINGAVVARVQNTPADALIPVCPIVTGDSFTYRFDFVSSNANEGLHLLVLPGEAQEVGYCDDFEDSVGSEWSTAMTDITPVGTRRFLGQFNNQTVTLTLVDLPVHSSLTLRFALYAISSLDGSDASPGIGPDVFEFRADGNLISRTSFANTPRIQSYPGEYPAGSFPSLTGSSERNTLGYAGDPVGDSVYQLCYTFPHSASSVSITFKASGLQDISDESWGLDDVCVSIPTCLEANMQVSGSPCRCGIVGSPVVYTNRPNPPAATISDDCVTATIVIDNDCDQPITRNVQLCIDESVVNPKKGLRLVTSLFRPCVAGGSGIMNPMVLPPGKTVLQLAISAPSAKQQLRNLVASRGPINLPVKVLVDDPALDANPCALDSKTNTSEVTRLIGLRGKPGQDDDDSAESFRSSINTPARYQDSLNIHLPPEQLPKGPFTATAIRVFASTVGPIQGFDSLELRRAKLGSNPVCPDMSPAGLVAAVGVTNGVIDAAFSSATPIWSTFPLTAGPTAVDPACVAAGLFIRLVFSPGDNPGAGNGTLIGVDETSETVLRRSSTSSGLTPGAPCVVDTSGNFMIRLDIL